MSQNPVAPKTILIIEDEAAIAQMYRLKLEMNGYKVEIALDGESGLKLISSVKPDLVLLDIMMPHMNGDEVLKKIRSNPNTENLPVLILTNIGDESLRNRLEKLGVTSYIQKSDLTPKHILAKVNATLRNNNRGYHE